MAEGLQTGTSPKPDVPRGRQSPSASPASAHPPTRPPRSRNASHEASEAFGQEASGCACAFWPRGLRRATRAAACAGAAPVPASVVSLCPVPSPPVSSPLPVLPRSRGGGTVRLAAGTPSSQDGTVPSARVAGQRLKTRAGGAGAAVRPPWPRLRTSGISQGARASVAAPPRPPALHTSDVASCEPGAVRRWGPGRSRGRRSGRRCCVPSSFLCRGEAGSCSCSCSLVILFSSEDSPLSLALRGSPVTGLGVSFLRQSCVRFTEPLEPARRCLSPDREVSGPPSSVVFELRTCFLFQDPSDTGLDLLPLSPGP